MVEGLDQLRVLIHSIAPLPEEVWKEFAAAWKPFTAARREVVTEAGKVERYLYFVLDGVQRVYHFDEQDREATIVFTYTPSFGGVLDSFLLQQPSRYYYEALTKSTFIRADFSEIDALMTKYPALCRIIQKGTAAALSGILERLVELQSLSSEEKFRKLLGRSPHILQLVPHKYLANYLGIDATNFSKLLNKVIF